MSTNPRGTRMRISKETRFEDFRNEFVFEIYGFPSSRILSQNMGINTGKFTEERIIRKTSFEDFTSTCTRSRFTMRYLSSWLSRISKFSVHETKGKSVYRMIINRQQQERASFHDCLNSSEILIERKGKFRKESRMRAKETRSCNGFAVYLDAGADSRKKKEGKKEKSDR